MNRNRTAVVLEASQKERLLTQRWRDYSAWGTGEEIGYHPWLQLETQPSGRFA